uniref:DUF2778 domain-containing protein n=1 Tax=Ascaris lumbricoides TaxID=6252 RepID=A0A0M3IQ48_ASCLU
MWMRGRHTPGRVRPPRPPLNISAGCVEIPTGWKQDREQSPGAATLNDHRPLNKPIVAIKTLSLCYTAFRLF